MQITVSNYDKFISSLPHSFQNGRKRCDIVVTCDSNRYFVLGELKDRNVSNSRSRKSVRKDAKKQLLQSLEALINVRNVLNYIYTKAVKRCCYFNRQSVSPVIINAVTAFNRLANIFPDGFKMTHSEIEALNFEFWEYTGEQTLTMTG